VSIIHSAAVWVEAIVKYYDTADVEQDDDSKGPWSNVLLQNYPNPFNPDTWIPYQLREDADVIIKIYASTGQLVRTLSLGQKPAGFYTGKEKAAYWDGRNEAGEHVASGVYFYTLRAKGIMQSKKMFIIK